MNKDLRRRIVTRLKEDLVGPHSPGEVLEPRVAEGRLIHSRPSDIYLSGILWPQKTKMAPEEDERLGLETADTEDTGQSPEDEQAPLAVTMKPSSAGLSFATEFMGECPVLEIEVSFAMYEPEIVELAGKNASKWTRKPFFKKWPVPITTSGKISLKIPSLPDVHLYARKTPYGSGALISLILVNGIQLPADAGREAVEKNTLFQVEVIVRPCTDTKLVARPATRPELDDEDRSIGLLYRVRYEFATGHTCSARWETDAANSAEASMVATTWLPESLTLDVDAAGDRIFRENLNTAGGMDTMSADWLSKATDRELNKALNLLVGAYGLWLDEQEKKVASEIPASYLEPARSNIRICRNIQERMQAGADKIGGTPEFAEAFRLANQAISRQFFWKKDAERRKGEECRTTEKKTEPMRWRPFQLGFILLAALSTLLDREPEERALREREIMDLLWFPTGGGKTEAYLGLVAMLIFHRRLKHGGKPDTGEGVAAVMRYTLRLLTTQQFARASALILACEEIRRSMPEKLGQTPFSIGLWIGQNSTPNTFDGARKALLHQGAGGSSTPRQLVECPACGQELEWRPFDTKQEIRVRCTNPECSLSCWEYLPVWTVDENIYDKRPSLLIGTIDKFAQLVRNPNTNALFGVPGQNPPDLIIQDELHLIGGPLGTLAGLYEALVDRMFSCNGIKPKIIGSTATIRRATEQVHALYDRKLAQFPPPCLDADDSGFAVLKPDSSGRLYCGVTTVGRSAKFTLQAVAASLLQSAYALDRQLSPDDPHALDNWWTLLTYFNSLRELGGALVLMQDDVHASLAVLAAIRKEDKREPSEIQELTSRLGADELVGILTQLAYTKDTKDNNKALDVVLASNMFSVGVDIPRLGLMLVNGQPKSMSEYIQSTSRVGRGGVPGLVVSVLNNAKSRDRSHYENFSTFHAALYRDVEAVSVTPFAPRARDKALRAIIAGLVRHLLPGRLENPDIGGVSQENLAEIKNFLIARAEGIDPEETDIPSEIEEIFKSWMARNPNYYWDQSKAEESLLQGAEQAAAKAAAGRYIGSAWPAPNSMRTVEPSVPFRLKNS